MILLLFLRNKIGNSNLDLRRKDIGHRMDFMKIQSINLRRLLLT